MCYALSEAEELQSEKWKAFGGIPSKACAFGTVICGRRRSVPQIRPTAKRRADLRARPDATAGGNCFTQNAASLVRWMARAKVTRLRKQAMSLIDDLTAHGAQIRERLWDLLERHRYPDDARSVWIEGSVAQTLEHHDAISLLVRRQLTGSAFALVRPLVETVVRALWIYKVASDEQVEQARHKDKGVFPSLRDMRQAVGQAYAEDEFFQQFTAGWGAMCDYTHSGARQIARRFTGTDVKPDYREGAIAEAVHTTNFGVLFLARLFFEGMNQQAEANEVRTLLADYRARDYVAAIKRLATQTGA
jgi:hypothetical protein